MKNNTVLYLSVFDWPEDGNLIVPRLKNKVISARLLATGARLKTIATVDYVTISLPVTAPDSIASVIKIEVEGTVAGITSRGYKKQMQSGAID